MQRALLFDLDGTLLHTDPLHAAVFEEMFADLGHAVDTAFYLTHIHGRHNLDIFAEFRPGEDGQALSDAKEALFRTRLGTSFPPMPGITALLDRAEAESWPIALVTNAPRDNAEAMLGAIGLRSRFDTLIIGDECRHAKPHPAPYLVAMEAVGVPAAQCIAFEDSPSGIRAAAASGALTVGLRSSLSDAELRTAGATITIQDFEDPTVPAILARPVPFQGALTA